MVAAPLLDSSSGWAWTAISRNCSTKVELLSRSGLIVPLAAAGPTRATIMADRTDSPHHQGSATHSSTGAGPLATVFPQPTTTRFHLSEIRARQLRPPG